MAKYDFYCKNCNATFTIEQSIKDDLPTDCPKCKAKNSLRQNYRATPILFKSKGFYCTDTKKTNS
ncbi:MAG: FmdB family zinc ribbon protein [Pleomorphochaeta sp.]|jgi:putative FmdB family regulatory protein